LAAPANVHQRFLSLFWEVHAAFVAFSNPPGLSTDQTSFVLKDYLLAGDADGGSQPSLRHPVPQYLFSIMMFM